MVGSSTLMAINKSNLRSIKVAVPKKIEQQKIASCLSSLDEIIATHSQKLDLLKDHKKGLMQNLFPQEGEKVPKYRFKEFENDGEWVEEPLSSKISVIDGDRGLNYPKAEEYSSDGYCLFLSAKNVTKSGFLFNEFQFITKEKDELLRKGKLARFDIVLTTRGSLGQFAFFDENIQFENIRINSGMVILRAKDNGINPNYLYSYFNSNSIQSAIKSQGFGNAVQQLTVAVINNFTLRYPYSPKEQQKIAYCLSSLDALITAQAEKIEQLKLHKKGLMQGLFPKINE
jgi:type I restriction enzyme S subunit